LAALLIYVPFLLVMILGLKPLLVIRAERKMNVQTTRQGEPLNKVELSLLLVAVLLVGVLGFFLINNSLSNQQPQNAALAATDELHEMGAKFLTPSPTPTLTPTPTLVMNDQLVSIPFNVQMSDYSNSLDRMIVVSTGPNQLHVYNPETGEDASIDLAFEPTALTLSIDGHFAAVGHKQKISYVDLVGRQVTTTLDVDIDVGALLMPDNGWIYAFSAYDDMETDVKDIRFVNLATNESISIDRRTLIPTHQPLARQISGVLSQDGKRLYLAAGPSIYRYDMPVSGNPTSPAAEAFADFGKRLFLSRDGNYLFADAGGGRVFKLANDSDNDLRLVGYIPIEGGEETLADQRWIMHANEIGGLLLWPQDTLIDSGLDYRTEVPPEIRLPRPQTVEDAYGEAYAYRLEKVVENAAGSRYYLIYVVWDSLDLPPRFALVARDVPSLPK
jgi:hypothetical protein